MLVFIDKLKVMITKKEITDNNDIKALEKLTVEKL